MYLLVDFDIEDHQLNRNDADYGKALLLSDIIDCLKKDYNYYFFGEIDYSYYFKRPSTDLFHIIPSIDILL